MLEGDTHGKRIWRSGIEQGWSAKTSAEVQERLGSPVGQLLNRHSAAGKGTNWSDTDLRSISISTVVPAQETNHAVSETQWLYI